MYNFAALELNYFFLRENVSESDIFRYVWSNLVDKAFLGTEIFATSGEKLSNAVTSSRNAERKMAGVVKTKRQRMGSKLDSKFVWSKLEVGALEAEAKRERKITGAKVDILFQAGRNEVGCCEAGKDDVLSVDGKYLDDRMMKLLTTLSHTLRRLTEANSTQINELYAVGFVTMGLDMELLVINVPAGCIVTRVTRSKKFSFPSKAKHIITDFLPLLELTLIGRELMTNIISIVDNKKKRAVDLNDDEDENPMTLP